MKTMKNFVNSKLNIYNILDMYSFYKELVI